MSHKKLDDSKRKLLKSAAVGGGVASLLHRLFYPHTQNNQMGRARLAVSATARLKIPIVNPAPGEQPLMPLSSADY